MLFLSLILANETPASSDGASQPTVLVTASRTREKKRDSAASATVIDRQEIERMGEPFVDSFLRLTPSAAVETSGPMGSFSEVRIRGAEANHTLLFIDGIRANDPASNDTPRFELLNSDMASRIEVVRGPQSALWGSDAIGGVIAVDSTTGGESQASASAEAGSFGFERAAASASLTSGSASLAGGLGWQRATGIDSFNGSGDKDGFRNLSGRVSGQWNVAPGVSLGGSAFSLTGRSEFDGYSPSPPYAHADTLDSSRNRLSAARLSLTLGDLESGLSAVLSASALGSSNRNFLGPDEINRTSGSRQSADAQLQYLFDTGTVRHVAILALGHDRETFHGRDSVYGGATDQDRRRSHDSLTAEWRADAGVAVADVAFRRDRFDSFKDASTARASLLVRLPDGFSTTASYSEGIAQPTFFDLYGSFPGSFSGNPSLKPESSHGWELSLRYSRGPFDAAITGYRQKLNDEIVTVYDPSTFLSSAANRSQSSRRSGVEAEIDWSPLPQLRLHANYAYLHATEPDSSGLGQVREVRRPRHSGSIAADGSIGSFAYGASAAYVGSRGDNDFDVYPAAPVTLGAYWLVGARLAYRLTRRVELFARAANLLDQHYEDVFGYRTEGRAVYAGFRISSSAGRQSSP